MARLNQIIAIEKGVKSKTSSFVSDLYKSIQKKELFIGLSKTYRKKNEASDDLPDESTRVQITAGDALRQFSRAASDLYEITARKDWTNMKAHASVVIDGIIIVENAPVTFLLFLEKNLTDVRTFINHLPILDEIDEWTLDAKTGLFKTGVISTQSTKKVVVPVVLYPATPEHPAQTQLITEDICAGYWDKVKQSGALPKTEKVALLARIDKFINAVKSAREEANNLEEIKVPAVSDNIWGYILGA